MKEHYASDFLRSVQFSSVAHLCPTLCDPMNRSTPGLPIHHHLPEFTHSCPSSPWCHPAISSSVVPFSSYPQSLPASESFPMSQLVAWGGQSIGASALASFLLDSQWEFAVWLRKLKQGSVSTQKSRMGREMGGKFKREGLYVYLWLIHVEVWEKTKFF